MSAEPDTARAALIHAKRLRILWIVLGSLGLCCLLGGAARIWIGHRQRTQALLWYRPASEAPADVDAGEQQVQPSGAANE